MRRKLPVGPPNSGSPPVRQRSPSELSSGPSLRHPRRVVARRKIGEARRARPFVCPADAGRLLVLARLGRLQQGKTEFPIGGNDFLSLRCERRNPAIGWIDDQRSARARAFERHEHIIVGAGHVALGPALRTPLATEHFRPHSIQFGALRLREHFLVRVLGGALQRRSCFVGPNALQVGFTPRCFQRWRCGGSCRRLSPRHCREHRNRRAGSHRSDSDPYHQA